MPETVLKIRILGDSILRKKAKPVKGIGEPERKILSRLAQLMYDAQGIGLAAPQVGICQEIIVVDIGSGLYKLINPKIIKKEGNQSLQEGCLSVPGVNIKVKRFKKIRLSALDDCGKPVVIDAEGLLACVFQHEIDHLKGRLIVDYASFLTRMRIKKKLDKLAKQSNEKLPEPKAESKKLQL